MKWHFKLPLVLVLWCLWAPFAKCATAEFLFGPPAFGSGASNGPTFSFIDYQMNFTTQAGTEFVVSYLPGILIGHRFSYAQFYLSLGGGLIVSASNVALGANSAFGYRSGTGPGFHFISEYRHAAGVGNKRRYFANKVIRIGLQYEF